MSHFERNEFPEHPDNLDSEKLIFGKIKMETKSNSNHRFYSYIVQERDPWSAPSRSSFFTAPWSPADDGSPSGQRQRRWWSKPRHLRQQSSCTACSSTRRRPGASWRPERGAQKKLSIIVGHGILNMQSQLPFRRRCRCIWSAG